MKKRKKADKKWILFSIVLSMVCGALMFVEIRNCREGYLQQYEKSTGMYLEALVLNGQYLAGQTEKEFTEGMIRVIETEFPTSARSFCLVGKNNEILFLRDKTKTAEMYDLTVEEYIRDCLEGKDSYLITRMDYETDAGVVTVAICTQEDYLLKSGRYNVLQQHLLVYLCLLAVAFVVSVVYLSVRLKEKKCREQELCVKLAQDRTIIERLSKRLESRKHRDVMGGEGSFYARNVVERVLGKLTREQRKKCRKVIVYFDKKDQATMVRLAVLLERMLNGAGIFCLWAEDEYQIILLNADDEIVENVAKQLILQYREMFQREPEEVHVIVDRL